MSAHDQVQFIELIRKPAEELKQEGLDLTLNEIKLTHHRFPELSGTNMTVSIKEDLFDTTDIDFKNRINVSSMASDKIRLHATNMASIAAGGGNSDPTAKGVAWDAIISSSDFAQLLPDDDSYFLSDMISVQNHSYGTGIENYYGIESAAYDALCNRIPELVHVFSSGNEGSVSPPTGTYAGLAGWANLTGQFKQSKNTITVGATDSIYQVINISSKGPAYDGRIKPEIVAYGHGGSSGAAAIVSGAALILQQAYENIHGSLPPSSLIKALLINSAKDILNPGPDFTSGFGSLQLHSSLQGLINEQFVISGIKEQEVDTHDITIPPGTLLLKVTLAWNDLPADPLDPSSLINDLDLRLEPNNQGIYLVPWVLKIVSADDSLSEDAHRGIDSINNVEQITTQNPFSGVYHINVHGKKVTNGAQEYSLAWEIISSKEFTWVFPTRSDHLVPDVSNRIRWNSQAGLNGRIEFRKVGVSNWNLLADDVDPDVGYYNWNVPSIEGLMQLRWTSADTSIVSDTFVVANPVHPEVELICGDSIRFGWESKNNVDSFEIFRIGEKHLEHYTFTQDTVFVVHQPDTENRHYAVAPYYNSIQGPISYGIDYQAQSVGCYVNSFYLRFIQGGKAYLTAELGTTKGIDYIELLKFEDDTLALQNVIEPITDASINFISNPLRRGPNRFILKIVLLNGIEVFSDPETVYYFNEEKILIFPNPTLDVFGFTIVVENESGYDLEIYNMQGNKVHVARKLDNVAQIQAINFPPGTYILKVTTEENNIYSRIIVISN